jgi:Pyruvate/2-oxoacid:ferredoxin oxidoreductase gamma subunit
VVAFCRIADKEIRLREPIMEPDALIIQDPTLLHQVDVFSGLKKDGYILINSTRTFESWASASSSAAGTPTACAPCRPPNWR